MEQRENFGSRLGFLLVSAGCAIGIGNVWRFPFITGQYGGAAFVLLYLFFLVILGWPVMTMEFAVGRGSGKSASRGLEILSAGDGKKKWGWFKWFCIAGNYILMMYYTTVAGWMLSYVVKMARGTFAGMDVGGAGQVFSDSLASPSQQIIWMLVVTAIGWFLGGQVGIGTVLSVLYVGPALQTICRLTGFDAAKVTHQNLLETLRILSGKRAFC